MSTPAEAIAATAMTPEERQAVEFANNYYGAEAKLEAARLLTSIGLEESTVEQAVGAFAVHLDGMDFVQKREVTEHLRKVTDLCGEVVLPHQVHLVPVEEEAHEPGTLPLTGQDDKPTFMGDDDTLDSGASDVKDAVDEPVSVLEEKEPELEPVVPHKFSALQKRFITDLLGEHNVEKILQLSTAQFGHLMQLVGEHYVSLKIARLSAEAKAKRRDLTHAYIYERKSAEELAAPVGLLPSAISNGARNMIGSIRQRTDQSVLDEMLSTAMKYREEPQPDAPTEAAEEVVEQTQSPADTPKASASKPPVVSRPLHRERFLEHTERSPQRVEQEVVSLRQAIRELAVVLVCGPEEKHALSKIFDTEKRNPEISDTAMTMRETTRSIFEIVKSDRRHTFTHLEDKALDTLLGNEPITVHALKARLYQELRSENLKIDQVLKSAIMKIVEDRKKVLRSGGVLAR